MILHGVWMHITEIVVGKLPSTILRTVMFGRTPTALEVVYKHIIVVQYILNYRSLESLTFAPFALTVVIFQSSTNSNTGSAFSMLENRSTILTTV